MISRMLPPPPALDAAQEQQRAYALLARERATDWLWVYFWLLFL